MELFIELETLKLVTSQTDRREQRTLTIKRGDALPLTVRFLENQTPTRLDATTVITFALKENGKYDDDPVVLEQTFTASTVGSPDSDPYYTASPSLNTTELSDLFLIDADSSNDPASVTLMGELTWTATGDSGPTSIKTFSVVCENDVHRGNEGAPTVAGNVASPAASADLLFDDAAALTLTSGTITIDSWTLNLWDGVTGSAPSSPYLEAYLYPWIEWIRAIRDVINTSTTTESGFSITGSPIVHPTVKAGIIDDNTDDIYLKLIAKTGGTGGNSLAYSFAATPDTYDTSGTLSGGADSRLYTSTDFVSTLPEAGLDSYQKENALKNLVEQGKFLIPGGDLEVVAGGTGVIIKSPNASRWRITVDNSGNIVTTSL